MKKIFVMLFLAGALVFALAAGAMASNVYVDGLVEGNAEYTGINDQDFSGLTLGANLTFEKIFLNLEYAQETSEEDGDDSDMDTINLKCGYAFFVGDESYLALTAGYHQKKPDTSYNPELSGALIGLTAVSNLGGNSRLEGSAAYSVDGTYKVDGDPDTDLDILQLQIKYSFFFTENFGAGIGYRYTQYKFEDDDKTTHSGPTVGVTYRF
ncbi:MAG: outer membrane beta-barrel protein [Bacillota bacterium]|jgi:opacity protein-like surface antigen